MSSLTTGIPELDRILGSVLPGDNIVWEADSGAPVDRFISSFLSACAAQGCTTVYVSFNRSPQSIVGKYGRSMPPGKLIVLDCFSSGKGNKDRMFLDFLDNHVNQASCRLVPVAEPADPTELQRILAQLESADEQPARYVFDSLTGIVDLWGDENQALRFFGHFCPRLYDLKTLAFWLLETQAHSEQFLAKVRHITQVVLEVALSQGMPTLAIRKAANRNCADIGVPRRFEVTEDRLIIATQSREDRELALLTHMGEALGSALDPNTFFEQTMQVLADELGMARGTLVLLDRQANRLRIAAAHGLSAAERAKGDYAIGEGITGHVVQTGLAQVIPDISQDARFLDRTTARRTDLARPIAFICVPVKVDDQVMGALSVDRPFAVDATLQKDLRLLSIVASIVSQVLKINRIIRVEKEEILSRDQRTFKELRSRYRLGNVIGQSLAIQQVLTVAATAAKSRASIIVSGETGTGKELVAQVVHYNGPRADGPFVKVSCGALPEELLESELFGHVKGAFTGAIQDRKGRFELAHQGTLFLDEVAETSSRLQVKLLRVLQEQEFEPVGSVRTVRVDVRVVAATNKDLKQEIRRGRFREDLFYRLNVIPIYLPPLRQRREDIPPLVDHFLDKYNRQNHKNVTKLSREVLDLLLEYPWPGNVRELENSIERAVVMSPGDVLSVNLLPEEIRSHTRDAVRRQSKPAASHLADVRAATNGFCQSTDDLAEAWRRLTRTVEETIIRHAVSAGLSQRQLARQLGISRMTLRKKMLEYDVKS